MSRRTRTHHASPPVPTADTELGVELGAAAAVDDDYTPADIDMDADVDDEDAELDEDEDEEDEDDNGVKKPAHSRARKPTSSSPTPLIDTETVVNDEYLTPNDPKGDRKISELGVLQNGRQFRVKTFKVPNRGDRLYAISTDVARLVGYRDSYFLFQKHTSLYRFKIDDNSKMTLIKNGLLPTSFKTRSAYLITARSAFKEFGARLIVDGKQVIDDYYEDNARLNGAIEGALINPLLSNDNPPTIEQTLSSSSASERNHNIALLLSNNNILETESSWIYDHALKSRQFDSMLYYDRNDLLKKRVQRDYYTNLNFVPSITQSTKCKIEKINTNTNPNLSKSKSKSIKKLQMDTILGGENIIKTGLSSIPLEIFDGTVSDEIKQAILDQQRLENSL